MASYRFQLVEGWISGWQKKLATSWRNCGTSFYKMWTSAGQSSWRKRAGTLAVYPDTYPHTDSTRIGHFEYPIFLESAVPLSRQNHRFPGGTPPNGVSITDAGEPFRKTSRFDVFRDRKCSGRCLTSLIAFREIYSNRMAKQETD
jgi:hypothetical protein